MGGTAGLTGVAVAVPNELEVAPSTLRSVRVVLLAGRALHVDDSILDQGLLEAKREGERRRVIVTDVHSPPQLRIGEIARKKSPCESDSGSTSVEMKYVSVPFSTTSRVDSGWMPYVKSPSIESTETH